MNQKRSNLAEGPSLICGRKLAYKDLGNVLILGLGVSGKAASEYLGALIGGRVESLTIFGGKSNAQIEQWADSFLASHNGDKVKIAFDLDDASSLLPEGVDHFDLCIASPGISAFSEIYLSAQESSSEIISEVELAWRESPVESKWVAITGTNGKTTTTSLASHIISEAGFDCAAIGNIGDACIERIAKDIALGDSKTGAPSDACENAEAPTEAPLDSKTSRGDASKLVYVAEMSSYQLASTSKFSPDVAVILAITPDHLKWHKSHEHYANSKFKLLSNLSSHPESLAVLDAGSDEVREKIIAIRRNNEAEGPFIDYVPLGTKLGIEHDMRKACGSKNSAFVDADGTLIVNLDRKSFKLCKANELSILGDHNKVNALAAAACALFLGANEQTVSHALISFLPLEHRIEPVDEVGGVSYYNDSKATNVDATLVALTSFLPKKPIVMLGGDDKGTDLSPLVDSCANNVKACVCFGEAKERFFKALSPLKEKGIEVKKVDTFDEAFSAASDLANPGDVVLLSPACASFDEFSCFEERGRHFKDLVKALDGRVAEDD